MATKKLRLNNFLSPFFQKRKCHSGGISPEKE
jgi:hypothetical protein